MAFTNTPKPSAGTMTNTARVSDAELWSTITTTWAAETRTWIRVGSLLSNTAKPAAGSMTNTIKPS